MLNNPWKGLRFPGIEDPRFHDNWHVKVVRLSDLRTGNFYPQEISLVLIFVFLFF